MNGALDMCGCFPTLPTPPEIHNRPGLERLAYRTGTHPEVLARLLASLERSARRGPLAKLTTRLTDDPAIALLDAFATVADVLGFYSERIVGEGFLRTATERRSLLELARLIGYELRPGVAASTWLAFEVEDRGQLDPASTEPPRAVVARGTRVQSVPVDGDLPQTFETSEDLVAHAERNVLRPQLSVPAQLDADADSLYLAGTATLLEPGDTLVLAEGSGEGPITGSPKARRAARITSEPDHDRTRVDFVDVPAPIVGTLRVVHQMATLQYGQSNLSKGSADAFFASEWTDEQHTTFLGASGWAAGAIWGYLYGAGPQPRLPAAAPGVYAMRDRRGVFGHNAPRVKDALTQEGWKDWDSGTGMSIRTMDSQDNAGAGSFYDHGIDLDAPAPRVVGDSWLVLERAGSEPKVCRVESTDERSRADFALSGKVAHVELTEPDGKTYATGLDDFKVRTTSVHVESQRLELAPVPLAETVPAATTELTLDALAPGMSPGKPIAFAGEDAELFGVRWTEVVTLTAVTHQGRFTRLAFRGLTHAYKRSTLEISANVVAATHGESTAEPLGSGTGAADQRFTLRQAPLTHVATAEGDGAATTLEVRVDGVLWKESRGLFGLGPRDERYVVRRGDDGSGQVIFGDGERGARPQSGLENIVAAYRHGIGAAGMVPGGRLSLLQTRPPGIRGVINPVPAFGAEDPETLDAARGNAPLTVLTLDRVVSLSDYEDYATAFAGIGKARATALWRGERQVVHVSVAAPAGADAAVETRTNLTTSLRSAGDPGVDVRVDGFRGVAFQLAANVLLDGRREPHVVIGEVRAALATRFAFERRQFGQGVSEAEAIVTIVGVDGVVDAQVTILRPVAPAIPAGPEKQDPLLARLARWSPTVPGVIEPAELLFLSAAGATITERGA